MTKEGWELTLNKGIDAMAAEINASLDSFKSSCHDYSYLQIIAFIVYLKTYIDSIRFKNKKQTIMYVL